MAYNISGIQQVGIGVSNLEEAAHWYATHLGMNVTVFSDEAEASLMSKYTGGQVHKRKANLIMNFQGGGGFEIWQFISRKGSKGPEVKEGDLGISHVHLRTANLKKAKDYFSKLKGVSSSEIKSNHIKKQFFELKDPFGNQFKIIEDDYLFFKSNAVVGGVMGVTIGVSDLEKAKRLYSKVFKYEDDLFTTTKTDGLSRSWLAQKNPKQSAFSDLLGPTKLELVCDDKSKRSSIFQNRYWGDLGFIHVCFDVQQMNELRERALELNYPFQVDSEESFDMGEAAGQFAYIEDPDKTLIELVETHKVPIIKKLGLYIHLKDKKIQKPLPRYIFKVLRRNKVV